MSLADYVIYNPGYETHFLVDQPKLKKTLLKSLGGIRC